ncbi:RING-H2 finger protein ATL16 [Argentina anserina]|uniref:RING-H2 finger protein ATL16 n=1 Tax=Argentina anserina TaxID=57926 RepID=UPI0021769329|nr:RING-H2 finger protein ATL16 [Potentilla anserina]
MDLVRQGYLIHVSSSEIQALAPVTSPGSSIFGTHVHHSDTSFPIIAIAIIGIIATAFLLVSYYIFVIKCCLNWHRVDLLRRFSLSRNRRDEDQVMVHSPGLEPRGLDEAVIRSIPLLQYKKEGKNRGEFEQGSLFCECAVCLNEFQEDEKLRIIPNCSHVFHIDCIDVWLQNNANCPLCRTSISSNTTGFPFDRIVAPSSSPQVPTPGSLNGGDEDYVVIELSTENNPADQALVLGVQERLNSGELSVRSISPSPRKMEQIKTFVPKKVRKFHNKVTSMGDECIDIRGKDEQFHIQTIRRSFSMDSSNDRQLYLAVQEAVQQQSQVSEVSPIEGCSSSTSSRIRRSFFSFGHGRGSRSNNAILPVYLEP